MPKKPKQGTTKSVTKSGPRSMTTTTTTNRSGVSQTKDLRVPGGRGVRQRSTYTASGAKQGPATSYSVARSRQKPK